ncbi:hypothetical protein DFR29_104389 [Tahibacter aquaticus]|uniref:Uncharacterized protein n=1 Tax=Tahibacter aquaticus TaxID=520092 RepID=A0A4R6Z2X2_9GAMM|nr:hypothetical protein [Tahibacter aquaticus]TDR45952.1 hypothetical protein DFR29_104389 [Tahibacter aquaticus]
MKNTTRSIMYFCAALLAGLSSNAAFAAQCVGERHAMEGADHHMQAICYADPYEGQLQDCSFAFGVYSVLANQYEQCIARDHGNVG